MFFHKFFLLVIYAIEHTIWTYNTIESVSLTESTFSPYKHEFPCEKNHDVCMAVMWPDTKKYDTWTHVMVSFWKRKIINGL
jgi:hypothetical protein